jgi:hypothetical protein
VELSESESRDRIRKPTIPDTAFDKKATEGKETIFWDINGAKPYGLTKVQKEVALKGDVVVK